MTSQGQTETGWLVGVIEDLMPLAAGIPAVGDDRQEHTLTYGDARPATVAWSCGCGGWTADADELHPFDVARAFLHHVHPSRYGSRPSIIMAETLRSLRQRTTTNPTR